MAYYRLGDVIRMKRNSLGLTREELSEKTNGTCSLQTLYRIEYGKVKVKPEVFSCLMRCMEQFEERNYAMLKVKNYRRLNLRSSIGMHLYREEYEEAKKELVCLEKSMEKGSKRNEQYLLHIHASLKFYAGEIDAQTYINMLLEALCYTIPEWDKIEASMWPYKEEEISIIMSLVTAYRANDMSKKALELLKNLKKALEYRYLDEEAYAIYHSLTLYKLADIIGSVGMHEEAVKYSLQGVEECIEGRNLGSLPNLLCTLVWNSEQLMEQGALSLEYKKQCLKQLEQAYYISFAVKKPLVSDFIRKHCERFYPQEITFIE